MNSCPCGSGAAYAACCEPIVTGTREAATAEALMRARYAAHAKVAVDFLFASTHPDHRQGYDHKGTRTWAEESEWLGLEIIETTGGGPQDQEGEVEFIARYRDRGGLRTHHERARFRRREKRWLFTEGMPAKAQPLSSNKVGRNDPCPCGSGGKYKKCCGK